MSKITMQKLNITRALKTLHACDTKSLNVCGYQHKYNIKKCKLKNKFKKMSHVPNKQYSAVIDTWIVNRQGVHKSRLVPLEKALKVGFFLRCPVVQYIIPAMKDTWIVTRQNPPENSKPKKFKTEKSIQTFKKKGFLVCQFQQ